jgi:hypothetical protein
MLVRFGLLIPPPHQFEDLGGTEKCIAKSVPTDFHALQCPEDEWIKISIFRRRHTHSVDFGALHPSFGWQSPFRAI